MDYENIHQAVIDHLEKTAKPIHPMLGEIAFGKEPIIDVMIRHFFSTEGSMDGDGLVSYPDASPPASAAKD